MRAILAVALLAVMTLVSGVGVTAQDKKDAKIDAKKLIGKWTPKEKGEDFVIEFTKDGKVSFAPTDAKDVKIDGTYKLDGDKLTMKIKFGDKEESMTRTITKLTDTELTSKDEKGKEDTLVRVKDKK